MNRRLSFFSGCLVGLAVGVGVSFASARSKDSNSAKSPDGECRYVLESVGRADVPMAYRMDCLTGETWFLWAYKDAKRVFYERIIPELDWDPDKIAEEVFEENYQKQESQGKNQ